MINQEFLSQCSDDQINKGVAWLLAAKKCEKWACNGDSEFYYHWGRAMINCPSDYCNQIIHAWPIMMANEISLIHNWSKSNAYTATGTRSTMRSLGEYKEPIESTTANPLRAICEVYILMMVSK